MEKVNRVRQLYGYSVCLIAVVTTLVSVTGVINNAIDLSNPVAAGGGFGESLASFEAYQASRTPQYTPPGQAVVPDTASEATLRTRYEAVRSARLSQRIFDARKGLISQLFLLLVAIGLFIAHWRWVRHLSDFSDGLSA